MLRIYCLSFIFLGFQPFSNNGDDVFMQVVVRNTASTTTPTPPTKPNNIQKSNDFLNKEIRENQRMQLVFKQQQKKLKRLKKQQEQQKQLQQQKLHNLENNHNSFSSPEAPKKSLTLKGRGKDTFFLLAQDTDAPGAVRDSRKVPNKVFNQLKKVQSAKLPNKDPRDLPTFPNYPVNMEHAGKGAEIGENRELTFHQAYGTDFDNLRPRLSTKTTTVRKSTKPVTRTTKAPTFILTPPEVNAPVAEFYRTKKRKKKKKGSKKKKKKPIHRLPKNHPLRSVLPPTARVVGIQPLRKLALSNRGENAEIMTLGDFLRKFPTMEKMKSTSIVPVPVTEAKHLRMIELLSKNNNQKPGQKQPSLEQALNKNHPNPFPPFTFEDNKADLDEMFKELEQLISKRAERKISFVNSQHHGLLHHDHRVKKQKQTQKQKQKQKSEVAPADLKKVSSSSTKSTQQPSGGPGLAVRPRGGLPGPRFMVTTKSTTQITADQTTKTTGTNQFQTVFSSTLNSWDNPKLEFGFVPITQTTAVPAVAATTVTPGGSVSSFASLTSASGDSSSNFHFRNPSSISGSSRFRFSSFDDIIDETDQLVAPRLPRQPDNNINSIETNEINLDHPNPNGASHGGHDAFFFTTTPKPSKAAVGVSVSPSSSLLAEQQNNNKFIKPGIFDMRKFFFIPTKNHHLSKSQAERRVHHNHHNGRPGFGPHERGSHPLPPPLLTPQHIQPHRGFKFRG